MGSLDKEGDTRPTEAHVEMNAPDLLEVGENFFNYPPFAEAIRGVSEATATDEVDLRKAVVYIAKKAKPEENVDHLISDQLQSVAWYEKMRKKPKGREAVKSLLERLDEFPKWKEYVRYELSSALYRNDGTYFQKSKDPFPIPSYPAWLQEQLRIDKALKNKAINLVVSEAFPHQHDGSPHSGSVLQLRVVPYKRWRVTVATKKVNPS